MVTIAFAQNEKENQKLRMPWNILICFVVLRIFRTAKIRPFFGVEFSTKKKNSVEINKLRKTQAKTLKQCYLCSVQNQLKDSDLYCEHLFECKQRFISIIARSDFS